MTIEVGDRVPEGRFTVMGADGPEQVTTAALFDGKRVLLFSVPGAFTPTCSAKHLPGYIELADAILAKGVDTIACMAVNDVFVMAAWGQSAGVGDKVLMLADGNATYAKALGLEIDRSEFAMGIRSQRFAMLVNDGIVERLDVEPPGEFGVSSAESVLAALGNP